MENSIPKLYFATSGIRGEANTVISPELGLRVGRAVAQSVKEQFSDKLYVYVGYDNRRNSHTIASTIVAGLTSSGVDAYLFTDPVPTPLVIHATSKSEAKAGLMVTGSHLPRDENGIILFNHDGSYFKGTLPESHERRVTWKNLGKIINTSEELLDYQKFLKHIAKEMKLKQTDWNILVDPVHGPLRKFLEDLLRPYVQNFIRFNWKDDDTFSGRKSEPSPKNLVKTAEAVKVSSCDFGIATDMDGDRVIFITNKGEVISGDYIGAILARSFWENYPNKEVVVPINTSAIIDYVADEMNGDYIYCKVGPPSIINKMSEVDAKYGFEETGKYFFSDYGVWPDAAISIIMFFAYLQNNQETLSEIIQKMPKLHALKTKVQSLRIHADRVMSKVREIYTDYFDDIRDVNNMDGIRISFDNRSWVLIRPSGTEDYIRVFSEHLDKDENERLNETGKKIVKEAIESLDI